MAGSIEVGEHETICSIVSHWLVTHQSGCPDFAGFRACLDRPNMRQNDGAWDFGAALRAGREGRRPDLPTWAQTLAPRLDAASDSHPWGVVGPSARPPWRGGAPLVLTRQLSSLLLGL